MADLTEYLQKRGISEEQMAVARAETRRVIDAYRLREAREANSITQVELARIMGVSQNRISRIEHGDLSAMTLDTIRRYVEAVGGRISLVAELPTGTMSLL